jgi:hypothetical protein
MEFLRNLEDDLQRNSFNPSGIKSTKETVKISVIRRSVLFQNQTLARLVVEWTQSMITALQVFEHSLGIKIIDSNEVDRRQQTKYDGFVVKTCSRSDDLLFGMAFAVFIRKL